MMLTSSPTLLESFTQLIATPSVSSIDPAFDQGNIACLETLANWLEDLGFTTELMPIPEHPGKANLIACLGRGEGGLVLSGHMDTVPCNPERWSQDPFRLTEKDGRLYGLGASDMKCFFPLVMDAVRKFDPKKLQQPLYLLATADEESTMSGALALVNSGRTLGRYALIGEPTGLKPVRMHKGIMVETIRLIGRAGHSSNPALGISALEGMHVVMGALLDWRKTLQETWVNNGFAVPVPTLNLGNIHGGDSPNRICAECTLILDLRLLPGMNIDNLRAQLCDVVNTAVTGSGLKVEIPSGFSGMPPMNTDIDSAIVRTAERLSGATAGTVAFATEAPYLNAMGMDTVILGPGDIDHAHQANEYIALDRLQPMVEILSGMIGHFCIEGKAHGN